MTDDEKAPLKDEWRQNIESTDSQVNTDTQSTDLQNNTNEVISRDIVRLFEEQSS